MNKVIYNVTDSPVVVDDEGRTVGGGEYTVADTRSEQVKAATERGALVLAPEPGDGADPAAVAAFKEMQDADSKPKRGTRADTDKE